MNSAMLAVSVVLLLSGISGISADHGGGTGGGCTGDCTPPTIGTDNGGYQIVSGGFAINGNAFDVKHFKQTIPTQTIRVNEPATITLTIYENSAPQFLEHVSLMFGLEEKIVSGVWVQTHLVQTHWERDFQGNTTVRIDDPNGLIRGVDVTDTIEKENNIITFEFTPTQIFDMDTILVHTWDADRNPWTNYFYGSVEIVQDTESSQGGSIPEWIKTSAGWWADGTIDDDSFVQSLQYLIVAGIITV